uniref:Uncharacterized protein n=1 Tax=viral metagenome TaxID=1070528 RepID=A0A6C0K4X5_9ZZZZ
MSNFLSEASLSVGGLSEKIPWSTITWILVVAVVVAIAVNICVQYRVFERSNPSLSYGLESRLAEGFAKENNSNKAPLPPEGFFGSVARGAGHPDCLRTLNAGPQLLGGVVAARGSADYAEFQVLLSKLGCLKKDIMSPSGIVEATRYQPYETAHDRQPVAEVAATCLNRTIAPRDLDITFKTWNDRGKILLLRLCTLANLKEGEVVKLEKLFVSAVDDVFLIAKGRCIATPGEQEAGAHDAQPYEPQETKNLREYNGYFSGWGGAV